ncbi:hypothetical protein ACXR0O_20635 [Verrucomicrobiota bacterium sgz303538]
MKHGLPIVARLLACGIAVTLVQVAWIPLHAADAPASAASEKIYNPSDLENLRGVRGKEATVEGTLVRAGESKTKTVRYLNFSNDFRESLALVFFVSKGGDAFAMEKLQSWIGKKVRATGKVSEYGSNVQMEIEKWDQLKELK